MSNQTKDGPEAGPHPLPDLLRGSVEPHAPMLKHPPADQLLYNVMRTEYLIDAIAHSYLHFNRVDSYRDFSGADVRDGEQLHGDRPGNRSAKFAKAPDFSVADYYDQSRGRTYAYCLSLENADYIWREYGNGGSAGKACIVFHFSKLRHLLNAAIDSQEAAFIYNGQRCAQIFSINHGIVDYVDWKTHRANTSHLPNPLTYTYMKDQTFAPETELRVSLSTLGLGHFVLADRTRIEFPPSLRFGFDYARAVKAGAICEIIRSPDSDKASLDAVLASIGLG